MYMQALSDLSADELERIERRVVAASAGPWISYAVGRDPAAECNRIETGVCNELGTFTSIEIVGGSVADQDFMACARQDIPRLLQFVRLLRALLAPESSEAARAIAGMVEGGPAMHPTAM
jgi:hypothetical protein